MGYDNVLVMATDARNSGKTIGLVQGSWDLFHLGHLRYILRARELCDYLIIAMDSDDKIKKRKGNNRPIIPEKERYDFLKLLGIADDVVIKDVNEPKWGLIKSVRPDVLIAIKENYTDEQIVKLKEYCKDVAILERQSESSTSDKIRKMTIANQRNRIDDLDSKVLEAIDAMKKRIGYSDEMASPIPELMEQLKFSTDWVCPVACGCYYDGRWYFGTNQADFNIPLYDVLNRTELYYATCMHAEINMLKKLGDVEVLETDIFVTLFPCDRCMKVLIDKGVRKIYYLEDHLERNWSKRSHELAAKYGVETVCLLDRKTSLKEEERFDYSKYKYVYPPNAREQKQLDIMIEQEENGIDPFDPEVIEQDILFSTNNWYVTKNRFPYDGIEHQFLVIAYNPIYSVEEINSVMWSELNDIWKKLMVDYNLPGGALCFRFGDPSLSGASLKRLHAHFIVPKDNSKAKFTIGGKKVLKKGLVIKDSKKN